MSEITKAVFPVAGLGTRFLPATKACPKEMLPIVDKPLIQYAAEEAIAAGATELIFITGKNKRSIEDHFDVAAELEASLEASGKKQILEMLRGILPSHVSCVFIRQPKALGLGHAVLCAKPVVGDAPFSVILADDLIDANVSATKQMADLYARKKLSILGVVLAYRFKGKRYDCGSKLGFMQANVELALKHPEIGSAFYQYLDNFQKNKLIVNG
jgi:UTP--glucose-1-phosphate uridylyltransferase